MGEGKRRRRERALFDSQLRRATATNSLGISALRAAAMHEVFLEQARDQQALTAAMSEHSAALNRQEVNHAVRISTLLIMYYAALNVVVEGWQDPKQPAPPLSDATIDDLLKSPYTKQLRDCRNSLLHHNPLDDSRFVTFATSHSEIAPWAARLVAEFERYFRDWRKSIARLTGKYL